MIACHQLTKEYSSHRALSEVSLEVASGSICALLGPNGAGKSTLVKILTGLIRPTNGEASVCGLPVNDSTLKNVIGILPENLALFDALTISEHLELTGAVYKIDKTEAQSRIGQLLRALRLERGRDTFIHQCSYGMKKKTALAMALLPNPKALFLDEPFEGIDPITAETIRIQLRALAARGVTIFLTSHILSLVDRMADQVVMINHGEVVLDTAVADLAIPLEDLYFKLVERAPDEDLEWLGSQNS
jgi:ABC-2 type transport system ATP-binding protein